MDRAKLARPRATTTTEAATQVEVVAVAATIVEVETTIKATLTTAVAVGTRIRVEADTSPTTVELQAVEVATINRTIVWAAGAAAVAWVPLVVAAVTWVAKFTGKTMNSRV